MALKKSDLYSSLWASCDELRGGMDARARRDGDDDMKARRLTRDSLNARVVGNSR